VPAQESRQPVKAPLAEVASSKPLVVNKETSDRPAWLPEKFKTAEDMAKSYNELERKLANRGGADAPVKDAPVKETAKLPSDAEKEKPTIPSEQPTAAAPVSDAPPEAREQLAAKGLNMAKYEAEFMDGKGLSKDSRAELNAAGFSDTMIDQYIAGAQMQEAELLKSIGVSKDEIKGLVQWTAEGLTKGEQAAYAKLVESKDLEQIKMGLTYAKQKYDAAHGKAPTLLQGRAAPMEYGYQSAEQLGADIRDPRYQKDPAFRDQVDQKMARSDMKNLQRRKH
jgi:hypothetical protein